MSALPSPDHDGVREPTKEEAALVKRALECYTLGVEAIEAQVAREKDDLRCQVPELMWPDDVKSQRSGQIVGNISLPPRPMISIPSLDQPVQLVLNQEKAAHLGVQIHALSEDADDDTAEVLQGLYRRIEVDSRAGLARSWAYERAVKAGRGAYRILTEYADDGGHFTDQKIVIKRLLHQESAVFDPFAQEPDWSDGRWAFITEWVPWDRYKRKYPESVLAGYQDSELGGLITTETPSWVSDDTGAGRAVLVAEYFYLDYHDRTRVLFDDDTDGYDDDIPRGKQIAYGPDGKTPKASRLEHVPSLKWAKINGVEVLEQEDRDGKYIPIVPVIGRELQPFDAERRWTGIYGPNKEAARMLNYAASGAIELAALESKAPYTMVEGQQEGHEKEWLQANVRNFPYLLYKPVNMFGTPAPPPQRTQVDTSRLGPSMLLLQTAREFIHSGTGAFEAALGQASPNQKTKGGVLALQQQHEQGNSHFLDNLATISITYEAKVILDLIPFVYDRPGRVVRVLDLEDNSSTVMLNQPFQPGAGPNGRPQPVPGPEGELQAADPKSPVKRFDLKKGAYGIAVSIGKAKESRIEEGSEGLGMLFQANPALFQLLGDVWLKFQTWPGHVEAAERMKKMLPPPLQEKEDGGGDPAAELEQAKAALAQMQQQMQEMGKAIETDQAKQQGMLQKAQMDNAAKLEQTKIEAQVKLQMAEQQSNMDADRELALQVMKNAATIAVAHIAAASKGAAINAHAEEESQALGIEVAQGEADRAHQAEMAERSHRQTLEQGDQSQAHALMQGEQSAEQQAAQAEQAHQQQLAQAEQQAALQPPPTPGAG